MSRPVGRPSRFPDAADKFIEHIEAGDFTRTAAALSGIHVDTVMNWLAKGREDASGEYFEFSERYARARGIALQNRIQRIERAGDGDWRCLAWLAERAFKEELCLTQPAPNISVSASSSVQTIDGEETRKKLARMHQLIRQEVELINNGDRPARLDGLKAE